MRDNIVVRLCTRVVRLSSVFLSPFEGEKEAFMKTSVKNRLMRRSHRKWLAWQTWGDELTQSQERQGWYHES